MKASLEGSVCPSCRQGRGRGHSPVPDSLLELLDQVGDVGDPHAVGDVAGDGEELLEGGGRRGGLDGLGVFVGVGDDDLVDG